MPVNIEHITQLEDLCKFKNKDGLLEILVRDKKGKYKIFQKALVDNIKDNSIQEKVTEAIQLLNKNNQFVNKNIRAIKGLTNITKFSLVLDGLNLCATCVGFAIMSKKLNEMSGQITDLVNAFRKVQGIQADFEYNKVYSEHKNMLDCRKTQRYYTAEQMRKLVDDEYNVLKFLIDVFISDVSGNRESLLYVILSLASMMAVSLKYFDEVYYFNNKDRIGDDDKWHISHDDWVKVFDVIASESFLKGIQDVAFLQLGYNTIEADYLCVSVKDQAIYLKQNVIDNQNLVEMLDNPGLLADYNAFTRREVEKEIRDVMTQSGLNEDDYVQALKVAVA